MVELLYIDEVPRLGRQIVRLAAGSPYFDESQVSTKEPFPDIGETVEFILASKCQALVTDFRLDEENDEVNYTGAQLIQRIRQRVAELPCFITTSYPSDAIDTEVDVLSIFSKDDVKEEAGEDGKESISFFQRVRRAIDQNQSRYERLSERHDELIASSDDRSLTPAETDELLEIDTILERRLAGDKAALSQAKRTSMTSLVDVMNQAQQLIDRVEKKLDEAKDGEAE